MGADVHIVLGRINLKAIEQRSAEPSTEKSLALFDNRQLLFDDFEMQNVPDEYDLWRNYRLFSWLSAVRGEIKPLRNPSELQALTHDFLDWYNRKFIEDRTGEAGFWHRYDDFHDRYDTGDHSRVVYTVNTLRHFNYEQQVETLGDHSSHWDDHPVYVRDLNAVTYREAFGEQYFKFLNHCIEEGWHFVLFGFDS